MPDPRPFHRIVRPAAHRDARLIIIASEGQRTEKIYLDDLAFAHRNPRVHVEVLDRLDSASSPEHILELLDGFRRRYKIRQDYDQLWLVLDVDRWRERKLSQVAELCLQKKYWLAISNPCFELWLLLHIVDLESYPPEILHELLENSKTGNRSRLERELVNLLGSYNKSNLDTSVFIPKVEDAILRARQLDKHPEHRWPNDLGSRVYLLVEVILMR